MFVYVITNAATGQVYVGKTNTPAKRWTVHRSSALSGKTALSAAMREHGVDAFEFAVVEECASEEAAFEAEKRWIAKLESFDPGKGYNLTTGGNGAFKQRASVVAKRAKSLQGQKRSAEQRANLAQSDHRYRHITAAQCWELYSQGLSCREVAKRLEVDSEQPIRRLLKLGGYELRESGRARARHITAEQCWELYSRGMSLEAVASQLGCNHMLVFRRLRTAGYRVRDAVESHLRLVV